MLDARARQQLVERAMGKGTRQVQHMLAEVDPEAAAPAERLRALGGRTLEVEGGNRRRVPARIAEVAGAAEE